MRVELLCAGLLLATPAGGVAGQIGAADDARQVHWQRSLDDALALCRASGRPLFIAVNTDAESASERIVEEVYRDERFVAASRAFVCVIASPYRHTPRDHDGRGLRVLDPRFGAVTSGEAVALEPAVFERFLGGQRIAPRHALVVDPGGRVEKRFDLYQLYDFEVLVRALEEAAAEFGGAIELEPALRFDPAAPGETRAAQWAALAAARDNANRSALEQALLRTRGASLDEALAAIATAGDAGSLDALRVVLARAATEGELLRGRLRDSARALGLGGPLAFALWEQLLRQDARAFEPGLAREALLLPLLGELHADLAAAAPSTALPDPARSARTLRSWLLSTLALGQAGPGLEQEGARTALAHVLDDEELRAALMALAAEGGAFDGASLLRYAARTPPAPRPQAPAEPLRGEDELAAELARLESLVVADDARSTLRRERGAIALELARVRLAAGAGGADLLLIDALADLESALEPQADDAGLWLLAARAAFLLGRFEDQERLALGAQAALSRSSAPRAAAHAHDWAALAPRTDLEAEACRWLGDASARRVAARAGSAAREEVVGLLRAGRALSLAAASAGSDAVDWLSLASFHGAIARRREELAACREGLERHPEDAALRGALRTAAAAIGRGELALEVARALVESHPDSAASRWWLGHALHEDAARLRLAQDAAGALERCAQADEAFLESVELAPDFGPGVRAWRARVALSAGFAHGLAGDRSAAAEALVRALALAPEVAVERDALDREALDLLDLALEWRARGESLVDALALGERLAAADPPRAAHWLASLADSELREALRAAGRGASEARTQAWLAASAEAARRALARQDDHAPARRALLQALLVAAERELAGERRPERAVELLAEAAALAGRPPPPPEAGLGTWEALAAALRAELGEAAPVTRPGR
jgi:hypothetical protein